jgi:hypothetical protein
VDIKVITKTMEQISINENTSARHDWRENLTFRLPRFYNHLIFNHMTRMESLHGNKNLDIMLEVDFMAKPRSIALDFLLFFNNLRVTRQQKRRESMHGLTIIIHYLLNEFIPSVKNYMRDISYWRGKTGVINGMQGDT